MDTHSDSQRGASKLTTLVFGALLVAAIYSAFQIIPIFYNYYEIENQMQTVIRVASTDSNQEIRQKLMYHIKKLDLPVDPEDLKIEREDHFMRISLPYTEYFTVTFRGHEYTLHKFFFDAYAEGDF